MLDVEVFRLTPETDVKVFEPVMAAAQRLGASELLVHGADAAEARLIETFGRLCDLAAGYGLSANLEPMPWVDVSTVAKARRIIDAAARRNSAVLVDAIHFSRANNSFADLKSVSFRYMQLCDARPECPSDMLEVPVAKKMEPLERARRALAATNAILGIGEEA